MPSSFAVWSVIGGLATLVVGSIILYYTGGWEFVRELLSWLRHSITMFTSNLPKPLKVLMFLFLSLTIADFVFGMWLNMN